VGRAVARSRGRAVAWRDAELAAETVARVVVLSPPRRTRTRRAAQRVASVVTPFDLPKCTRPRIDDRQWN
jgi:hypothetical protein